MFLFRKPSDAAVMTFLAGQKARPFSYADVGMTSAGTPPLGFRYDRHEVTLGEGEAVYQRACEAVRTWKMLNLGWVQIRPEGAPVAEGETLALVARAYGLWGLFGCRVVCVDHATGPVERFAFAYGTLEGHLLRGEERFTVEWDRLGDAVVFRVEAYSRPVTRTARLIAPLLRRLQRSFGPAALGAMTRAVQAV